MAVSWILTRVIFFKEVSSRHAGIKLNIYLPKAYDKEAMGAWAYFAPGFSCEHVGV